MNTTGVNYYFKGESAVADKYKYDKLPEEQKSKVELCGYSYEYKGAITSTSEDGKTVEIDQAIKVSNFVSEKLRAEAKDGWKSLERSSHKTFLATVITGIVSTLAGIGLGIGGVWIPQLFAAAVPLFLIGVTLIVGAVRAYKNEKAAQKQHEKWIDPTEVAQKHRQNASFDYTYNNKDLKGKYFHEEEIKDLWYGNATQEKPVAKNVESIERFIHKSPLDADKLLFAFGGDVPAKVSILKKGLEETKENYEQKCSQMDAQIVKIEKLRDEKLDEIEAGQQMMNVPFDIAKTATSQTEEAEEADVMLTLAAAPMNFIFGMSADAVKKDAAAKIEKIEALRKKFILGLHEEVSKLRDGLVALENVT